MIIFQLETQSPSTSVKLSLHYIHTKLSSSQVLQLMFKDYFVRFYSPISDEVISGVYSGVGSSGVGSGVGVGSSGVGSGVGVGSSGVGSGVGVGLGVGYGIGSGVGYGAGVG
jgi:hypothetical protein